MRKGQVVNLIEAGQIFGVNRRTIDDWFAAGCPGEKVGRQWRIDTAEVTAWLRERERHLALREVSSIDAEDAKRRKLAAEAALAEHELAVKQGLVAAIADWQAAMAAMIGAARAKLLPIPAKLGPMVAVESDPVVCEEILDTAIAEVLTELSIDGIPDDPGSEAEPGSSSAESGAAVGTTAAADGE